MNEVTVNGKPRPTGPVTRIKVEAKPSPIRCRRCGLLLVLVGGHAIQKNIWVTEHEKARIDLTGKLTRFMMPLYYCDACGRKEPE